MQDVKIVIGANFGDEGKGLMTDCFAAEAVNDGRRALVICSNGGAQRGHTVTTPSSIRHVFHHFGSGTLAGADTWLPRHFIVNPMIFMSEYDELVGKGVHFSIQGQEQRLKEDLLNPKVAIFMDPECPVTTPFDMITNQIIEEYRGTKKHGSCGLGIWETLLRDGLPLGKMAGLSDAQLRNYLNIECRNQMYRRLAKLGVDMIPESWKGILDDGGLIENYICDFRQMCSLMQLCGTEIMGEYDRLIFETGQGLLLDRCRKEYGCHTTPSNTGLRNPAELLREYQHMTNAGEWYIGDVEVCYVTRTYLTRHGAGPFSEECTKEEINPDMKDLTNVPNPHQGTLRYGFLDEKSFLRRIREDFDSERLSRHLKMRMAIAVTHVNEYAHDIIHRADYISDGETRENVK